MARIVAVVDTPAGKRFDVLYGNGETVSGLTLEEVRAGRKGPATSAVTAPPPDPVAAAQAFMEKALATFAEMDRHRADAEARKPAPTFTVNVPPSAVTVMPSTAEVRVEAGPPVLVPPIVVPPSAVTVQAAQAAPDAGPAIAAVQALTDAVRAPKKITHDAEGRVSGSEIAE